MSTRYPFPQKVMLVLLLLVVAACKPTKSPSLSTKAAPTALKTEILPEASVLAETVEPTKPPEPIDLASKLDEIVWSHCENGSFQGAVLIAREGKVLFSKGHGFADRQNHILNTSQTKFRLGSITKQFTATAIL